MEIIDETKQDLPNATTVQVVGILALVLFWVYGIVGLVLGIIAWIMGNTQRNLYYSAPGMYSEGSLSRVNVGVDGNSEGEHAYTWGTISEDIWEDVYANILGCNVVIEALPTMTYADSEYDLYCKLAAQAYTLRAYHYFVLVNLYAKPWSEANLDELGVVMRVSPDITSEAQPRATLGEIYALINEDLERAEVYFQDARKQYMKWEISPAAFYFLKSRVALFQEDWD